MKFIDLKIGQKFRFVQHRTPKDCIKKSNDSRFDGWGEYRYDPPTENFFGGNGYLCSHGDEVREVNSGEAVI